MIQAIKILMTAMLMLSFLSNLSIASSNYEIDEYEFEWKASQVGDIEISVIKTFETSYIQLYKGRSISSSYFRLSAIESLEISKALKNTLKYYKSQKDTAKDVSDILNAGEHQVVFRTSTKYGFSITISSGSFSFNSFSLTRKEAKGLVPVLEEAGEMIKFINSKITF